MCNHIVTQIKHNGQQCTTFYSPSVKSNVKFSGWILLISLDERKRFYCFLVSDMTICIISSLILMYFIHIFYLKICSLNKIYHIFLSYGNFLVLYHLFSPFSCDSKGGYIESIESCLLITCTLRGKPGYPEPTKQQFGIWISK
jgi:hypothetical protein